MTVITDKPRSLLLKIRVAFVVGLASLFVVAGAGAASAGPPTYPIVDVQTGAAARTAPSTASGTLRGYVTWHGNTQPSWVKCWQDGDWATGNYRTNRWFLVYVNETRDIAPQWLYVHASYVYNQKIVGRC
ncbi:hypothetical protein CH260_20450 [Rhodococcus sp. 05-2256-B2]|uniref:hypothetical protein n=1 Tax=unclassified Rhodococcus (in: high G+C Gram-positive bacteria) TaxID=192944 RepID=UPI000B9BFAFB|nr:MULTISPECIES: hypothetical protein [unclassified Rhodococcus (in: high G+C Gram-positive bacteria)]OZD85319.1 hypothetical protein CH258_13980 [Rhodococcus sp. 05-2256-B4]OZD92465.1 hypothetical protein CH260_20450 [Rhodococcus sp. 05-2256-B2]OZD99309.1 hypothetical protein CH257_00650 [Rhodococcus sp. 05-2256-B3]OZE02833.1 hypothetical protein CH285_12765 [Rhodococcus sp. 05-2256-B1]